MTYRGSRCEVALHLALCMTLVLGACASPPKKISPDDMAQASEALGPFRKQLMGALMEALEEGGPVKAISVCQLRAPEIARAASKAGLEIGRTSHRLRNPKNAPEAWMETFLEEYLSNPEDTSPRAVRLDDDRIGYVEPIRVMALCLTCHGQEIDDSVRKQLSYLYPEDRATGFSTGDLRGLFWVKLR